MYIHIRYLAPSGMAPHKKKNRKSTGMLTRNKTALAASTSNDDVQLISECKSEEKRNVEVAVAAIKSPLVAVESPRAKKRKSVSPSKRVQLKMEYPAEQKAKVVGPSPGVQLKMEYPAGQKAKVVGPSAGVQPKMEYPVDQKTKVVGLSPAGKSTRNKRRTSASPSKYIRRGSKSLEREVRSEEVAPAAVKSTRTKRRTSASPAKYVRKSKLADEIRPDEVALTDVHKSKLADEIGPEVASTAVKSRRTKKRTSASPSKYIRKSKLADEIRTDEVASTDVRESKLADEVRSDEVASTAVKSTKTKRRSVSPKKQIGRKSKSPSVAEKIPNEVPLLGVRRKIKVSMAEKIPDEVPLAGIEQKSEVSIDEKIPDEVHFSVGKSPRRKKNKKKSASTKALVETVQLKNESLNDEEKPKEKASPAKRSISKKRKSSPVKARSKKVEQKKEVPDDEKGAVGGVPADVEQKKEVPDEEKGAVGGVGVSPVKRKSTGRKKQLTAIAIALSEEIELICETLPDRKRSQISSKILSSAPGKSRKKEKSSTSAKSIESKSELSIDEEIPDDIPLSATGKSSAKKNKTRASPKVLVKKIKLKKEVVNHEEGTDEMASEAIDEKKEATNDEMPSEGEKSVKKKKKKLSASRKALRKKVEQKKDEAANEEKATDEGACAAAGSSTKKKLSPEEKERTREDRWFEKFHNLLSSDEEHDNGPDSDFSDPEVFAPDVRRYRRGILREYHEAMKKIEAASTTEEEEEEEEAKANDSEEYDDYIYGEYYVNFREMLKRRYPYILPADFDLRPKEPEPEPEPELSE